MGYPNINNLEVYKLANEIADDIYKLLRFWDKFHSNTMGYQLIRSVDSIAANISEGYGRHFYKENRQFCYYARGSLFETKTWLSKSFERNLISEEEYEEISEKLEKLLAKLNSYISYISKKIK
jgi:four helix bundle protein